MQALARIGHRDDADFMAAVLQDAAVDEMPRRFAAFGLGHVGGDGAVRHLEAALASAPAGLLDAIVIALGNTRSRAAVPVVIGAFGNNPARNAVCGAMRTLTHQNWCDGSDADPAATRRRRLRRFNDAGSNLPIFGPNYCWTDPSDAVRSSAAPPRPRPVPSGPPRIVAPRPGFAAPNAVLRVSGYDFETKDRRSLRAVFLRGTTERAAEVGGLGSIQSAGNPRYYSMDVRVPPDSPRAAGSSSSRRTACVVSRYR